MKRALCLIFAVLMIAALFAGCGKTERPAGTGNDGKTDAERLNVVATIFPTYDWVRNIMGDKADEAELTLLLDSGADLHSYQPTAADIMLISQCDLFLYVGGESDKWVDEVLQQANNQEMVVVNLMDALGEGLKEEELKEGMQESEEPEDEEEGPEFDEHVWLSLKNAKVLCGAISEALCKADPANAADYQRNTLQYTQKIEALDLQYRETLDAAKTKTMVFGDRFPFRYLVEDYGLEYYAAFMGCSAETEASFETVTFLVNKIDELGLDCVFAIEGTNHDLAETIAKETASGEKNICVLNSLQSVTAADVDSGADYLQIMQNNLTVLQDALS